MLILMWYVTYYMNKGYVNINVTIQIEKGNVKWKLSMGFEIMILHVK